MQIKQDLTEFLEFLRKKKYINTREGKKIISQIKSVHVLCYSLAIWEHYLTDIPERGKIFLIEVRSDALQSFISALTGLYKSTYLLLRGVIENFLRYVYFIDHPVEYSLFSTRGKYLTFQFLADYMKEHPYIGENIRKVKLIDHLYSKYDIFSKIIHATKIENMQSVYVLSLIKRDNKKFSRYVAELREVCQYLNLAFCLFHRKELEKFDYRIREFILKILPREYRKLYQGI